MQLTTQVKLLPTSKQIILIKKTMQEYIKTANNVVSGIIKTILSSMVLLPSLFGLTAKALE